MSLRRRMTKIESAAIRAMTDEQLEAIAANIDPATAEDISNLSDAELQAIADGAASTEQCRKIGK